MNNEELLEKLKEKYEAALDEDIDITKEIEELSKERYVLFYTDKIKKLEENKFILKNGKSFKGILKSYFSNPDGDPLYIVSNIIVNLFYFGLIAFSVYMIFGTTYTCSSIIRAIMYILTAIEVALGVSMPVTDIIHINKVNKKYTLEEVSLELENAKKRKKTINKEIRIQRKIQKCKQLKMKELKEKIQNIKEVMSTSNIIEGHVLASEPVVELNVETKEEGKK